MGEEPEGAWGETFGRLPTVTLRDIFNHMLWQLNPKDAITVADLTQLSSDIASTQYRAETQSVATVAERASYAGLRVPLRSIASSRGVVLFGLEGAHLPSAAGIGLWSATAAAGVEHPDLWKYIQTRYYVDGALTPVVGHGVISVMPLPGG